MTTDGLGRRQMLAASTGVASVVALGGCSAGSQSGGTAPSTPPTSGQTLISLSEVPVGGSASVTLDDRELIVTRTGQNSAVAFSAICTHQGCTVAPAENKFRCPCHGSTYNPRTGKVTGGPAPKPLNEVPVRVENGKVVTA